MKVSMSPSCWNSLKRGKVTVYDVQKGDRHRRIHNWDSIQEKKWAS